MENIIDLLREKNITPSHQRIKILEYLINHKNHPSAETIYNALSKNLPTLSKTTVYNTLALMKQKGLVNTVFDEQEIHYDATVSLHGHFICQNCKKLYDFPIIELKEEFPSDFQVLEKHVTYKGLCFKCLQKKGEYYD